jgi:hypothetical protein
MKARTGPPRTTTAANISAADGKAIAATSITTIVGIVVGNAMKVAIVEIMVVVVVAVAAIVMIAAAKTNADGTHLRRMPARIQSLSGKPLSDIQFSNGKASLRSGHRLARFLLASAFSPDVEQLI